VFRCTEVECVLSFESKSNVELRCLIFRLFSVLFCSVVLCCVALCCTVLYCTVLYCTVLYCAVQYCTVLYCAVLYCTALSVLCCVLDRYAVYCYIVFYPPMLFLTNCSSVTVDCLACSLIRAVSDSSWFIHFIE
jgi:hypothetical protein